MSAQRKTKRNSRATGTNQLYKRFFIVVLLAAIPLTMVGLTPAIISAESTRATQHAKLLQEEIDRAQSVSDSLEIQRAVLTNEIRQNQAGIQEMGMVRVGSNVSYLELNSAAAGGVSRTLSNGMPLGGDSVAHLASLQLEAQAAASADTMLVQESVPAGIDLGGVTRTALQTIAHLTAGEASTLLVGDVGLVSLR